MDMKRFFLYAIVIAALALAGCGGNGGGGGDMAGGGDPPPPPAMVTCPDGSTAATMDDCPPPGPTPEEMALKDAQDAAMAAYMMAMGYTDSAKDYIAMQNAMKYADMAKEANASAQAATTSAMAEEYQMAAETARDQAKKAAGERGLGITKLANMTVNQQQIENAELEGRPAVTPRVNAERVGPAMKDAAENMAVPTEVAVPTDEDTRVAGSVSQGGTSSDTAIAAEAATASAALERNSLGKITFSQAADSTTTPATPHLGVTRGGDPATTPALRLLRGEEPKDLEMRGGWPGSQLVRAEAVVANNERGMTYANVYTDIQPATQSYSATATTAADAITEGTSKIVSGNVPNDGSNFHVEFNLNPRDNVAPIEGQFRCGQEGGCSLSVDENGTITDNNGYAFHRSTGMAMQDSDYLAWGVWLTVPGAVTATGMFPDGATTTGVFASGNDVFTVNAALKGKATYNGVASGLYSAGGMVENFDADVMLEANFGGTVGADNSANEVDNDGTLLGAVTGMVSNIRAGGMDLDGSLALLRAPVLAGTRGTPTTATADQDSTAFSSTAGFIGDTDGVLGGMTYRGEWGGQFYGPNKATTDMQRETEFPTTAAGTFGAAAEGPNGASLIGAFGSWKAE